VHSDRICSGTLRQIPNSKTWNLFRCPTNIKLFLRHSLMYFALLPLTTFLSIHYFPPDIFHIRKNKIVTVISFIWQQRFDYTLFSYRLPYCTCISKTLTVLIQGNINSEEYQRQVLLPIFLPQAIENLCVVWIWMARTEFPKESFRTILPKWDAGGHTRYRQTWICIQWVPVF
jgi:hypothetical protein